MERQEAKIPLVCGRIFKQTKLPTPKIGCTFLCPKMSVTEAMGGKYSDLGANARLR